MVPNAGFYRVRENSDDCFTLAVENIPALFFPISHFSQQLGASFASFLITCGGGGGEGDCRYLVKIGTPRVRRVGIVGRREVSQDRNETGGCDVWKLVAARAAVWPRDRMRVAFARSLARHPRAVQSANCGSAASPRLSTFSRLSPAFAYSRFRSVAAA